MHVHVHSLIFEAGFDPFLASLSKSKQYNLQITHNELENEPELNIIVSYAP